jgi:methylated-DNA-[protein]-cysteine S-methyltransferase
MAKRSIKTPVGVLELSADDNGVNQIVWPRESQVAATTKMAETSAGEKFLDQTERELAEYFAKKRSHFTLPLNPHGTDFQKKVWDELKKIPYGETVSYSDIAKKIGKPEAVRAVGGAIGRNPLSIVVPCHRVVSKSGAITGFSGGIENKVALLEHEEPGA